MLDLSEFFSIQTSLLTRVPQSRSRFLKEAVNWNSRLLGIIGGRGTGKTTLLLQHLAEQDNRDQRHLYVSADHIRVQATGLYDIASYFFRLGGETIIIDEIHKYTNWHQEVKNLYDSFSDSKIFFLGSSIPAGSSPPVGRGLKDKFQSTMLTRTRGDPPGKSAPKITPSRTCRFSSTR